MDTSKPLLPKTLAAVLGLVAPLLAAAAAFLPAIGGIALGPIAGILAFLCAAGAGLALPQVRFAAGRPVVPLALVPVVSTMVPVVTQLAMATHGFLSVVLQALGLLLCFAAGLASPTPVVAGTGADKAAAVAKLKGL